MMMVIPEPLQPAFVSAAVVCAGWFVTNALGRRKDEQTRRDTASLMMVEHQIEEFYGPLLGMMEYTYVLYAIEKAWIEERPNDPAVGIVRSYFIENRFIPINDQIVTLIRSKAYLLEEGHLSKAFQRLLRHAAQEDALYNLYKDRGVQSDFIRGEGWPDGLDEEVRAALTRLYEEHARLTRLITRGHKGRARSRGVLPKDSVPKRNGGAAPTYSHGEVAPNRPGPRHLG